MIPGLLATEVSAALREFIVTGYETETDPFKGEFRRLVEEQQDGEALSRGLMFPSACHFSPALLAGISSKALRPSTRLMRTRSRPGRGWLPIDVLRIPW